MVLSCRAAASACTAGETPWALKTTTEPSGTSSVSSTKTAPRRSSVATTGLLWTVCLRAEADARAPALGPPVGLVDEARPTPLQRGHHVLVVDDLLADVDRGAVDLQGALDGDHRPVDAGAVAPGIGQQDASALISHDPIVEKDRLPPVFARSHQDPAGGRRPGGRDAYHHPCALRQRRGVGGGLSG